MLEREWFSLAELSAMNLPGMPNTARGFQAVAERETWTRPDWEDVRWRQRQIAAESDVRLRAERQVAIVQLISWKSNWYSIITQSKEHSFATQSMFV